jgi:hypothetical protein
MKKRFLQHLLFLGSLGIFTMAGACAGDTLDKSNKLMARPTGISSDALLIEIQTEVSDAACDQPQQCRSIAIGAKPCGGPDSYLAWSSKRTDEKKLRSLVEQHATVRKEENLRNNMQSDCAFVTKPGVICKTGRCALLPRGFSSLPNQED